MNFRSTAIVIALCLFSLSTFGDRSKVIEVNLDEKTTVFVEADTNVRNIKYYIDKTACICFLGGQSASSGNNTVSCKRLARHPKLKVHLNHCLKLHEIKSSSQ